MDMNPAETHSNEIPSVEQCIIDYELDKIPDDEFLAFKAQFQNKILPDYLDTALEDDIAKERLDRASSLEGYKGNEAIPCLVWDDPASLFMIYKAVFGEPIAIKNVGHEIQHAISYQNNNIPVKYGLIITKITRLFGALRYIPVVLPKYPPDMNDEDIQRTIYEATLAVTDPSDSDIKTIEEYESQTRQYYRAALPRE